MALVLKDRVKQITDTVGTGTLSVTSVSTGYDTFSNSIGNGNTTYYAIYHENTTEWEVGIGTVGSGTLSRDVILASSNGNLLVNFTSGNKAVWCDYPASKAIFADANNDVTCITGGIATADYVQFDTSATSSIGLGKFRWNQATATAAFGIIDGTIECNIGEQMYAYVTNADSVTILKGQAVYLYGATGNRASIKLANNTGDSTSAKTLGLATQDIGVNQTGFVTTQGVLDKLDTSAFAEGDTLYLGATAGSLTNVKPQAPNHLVYMGVVERANAGNGQIYVRPQNGYELEELHNVQIISPTTGQSIIYDASTSLWKNSNAPTIIGGSINNTPIGATTPNTVTATTLTAQTEVLKGTGQNFLLQSNTFTASWLLSATTVGTTVATLDPFGGSGAYKLVEDNTTSGHYIYQAPASFTGVSYVISVYLKAAERGYALLAVTGGVPLTAIQINLSTGAVTTGVGTPLSAFSTSLGNGWYRVGFSVVATSTGGVQSNIYCSNDGLWVNRSYLGTTGSGIYLYGVQLEIGSTPNTYIPTTTTAVYGTPSLSLSGVSGLGLESNGALYVSPAGTGALQAQATTSTATGGNARGANAVDWQTIRTTASQVASGTGSVIGGGYQNTSSGNYNAIGGGQGNAATASYGGVFSGASNTASGNYSGIASGIGNIVSGAASFIGGGHTHTAGGWFNFIGGGYLNTGTANAAVTTQATTTVTSGSTAVTLSGSNASIKVGQLITGTGIVQYPHTYVAAISGTTLTLSQNASASGTPTLFFFTPHGVVVGGGNNQATGSYSFIGGGGDAGTATNRNVASGDWATVVGGFKNTAVGNYTSIVGGNNNTVSSAANAYGFIGGGINNTVSGFAASILGGQSNTANSTYGTIIGAGYGNTRSITGYTVLPANNGATGAYNSGGAQVALLVVGKQTTDATATVLTSDNAAASTTNQVILPNNSAYYFTGEIVAGVTGGGNTKGWNIAGVIKRGATAASTAMVGVATVTSTYADAGAAAWTVAVAADTTNGGLKITVTGAAATTIRWVAQVRTTEMTY